MIATFCGISNLRGVWIDRFWDKLGELIPPDCRVVGACTYNLPGVEYIQTGT